MQRDLINAERQPSAATCFHIFSDLHLDNPKTLAALALLLKMCDEQAIEHQVLQGEYAPLHAQYLALQGEVDAHPGGARAVPRRLLERLEGLRERVERKREEMDEAVPPGLFVFCGNFRSTPFLFYADAVREYQGERGTPRLNWALRADR